MVGTTYDAYLELTSFLEVKALQYVLMYFCHKNMCLCQKW